MNEVENNLKDEEILTASLEQPALFRILVARYQGAFIRKALGIVRQQEEAEDIVQETFVKIYFNGKKFKKMDGIEFKSWAYRILVNTAISRYRKISKKWQAESNDPLDLETAENSELSTENIILESENKSLTAELLSRLPKPLARLVSLYYIEDKPYKEIAKQEGITMAALKMKLFRAKKFLKNIVQEKKDDKK
ncbi:MAG: RNA polymerase sigma factor [Candidatus Azambacteria bacterium]|nr:RNA polymerase sigma factor [Candidatus Azambacteria bacterium]